ncbi:hypothetical protein CLPUN_52000 [Clostridium puniceum]|uniref:Rad50/SbcC-type AAA domain-containing protein n=1 Tax=Clostridium puniceum TaxID=29367 RepID=A0A1S8SYV6_9CLOT|nr:hypothetical protein [Clostridium puniceum]OOM70592.1 hypothetical protein CLPUN_52000 [Clostridium puniceum]
MIIKEVYIGDSKEAYIFKDFAPGFNIIFSSDNNKGKTIVIQSIAYCLGNIPVFPTTFEYENYYYVLVIEQDGKEFEICRKEKNILISRNNEILLFDNISEFKRFWNNEIEKIPIIHKNGMTKISDPELFVQMFFVGQDKKQTHDIINKGYYRKEDYYNMIFSICGVGDEVSSKSEVESAKNEMSKLKTEKQWLLKENKILKKRGKVTELLGATNDRIALEGILNEADAIKDVILSLKKERNKAIARKKKNEAVLKELRSLNRNMKSGEVICMDCGSNHIAYESADAEFSFDVSTTEMRGQILKAIEERITVYSEEIERFTSEINKQQEAFDKCLIVDENITLDLLLVAKHEMDYAKDADQRLIDIERQLKQLEEKLDVKVAISEDIEKKRDNILNAILQNMNEFYKEIDQSEDRKYVDIFTKKDKVFSGSEGTEFHLAKMYALQKVLEHDYPIIIDSFRAEDLSTDREDRVIEKFKEINNQLIFTTTLKKEEYGKYEGLEVHAIDFSGHETYHILSNSYVEEFLTKLREMSINI